MRISDPLGLILGIDDVIYMKGVVMRFRPSIILTITLLILSMGLFCEAEAKTIDAGHATVSWKGKGVIDDLGVDRSPKHEERKQSERQREFHINSIIGESLSQSWEGGGECPSGDATTSLSLRTRSPQGHGPVAPSQGSVPSQDDHRLCEIDTAYVFQDRNPIHLGHLHIKHNGIRNAAQGDLGQNLVGESAVDRAGTCGDAARLVLLALRSFYPSISTFPTRNTPPETYLSSYQLHRP